MTQRFFARGKLLLTAEYAVLQGCEALAIPCKKGQHLTVSEPIQNNAISWNSYDDENKLWFSATFDLDLNILDFSSKEKALHLQKTLVKAFNISRSKPSAVAIETHLDFPRDWGLGSSSTLIHLISQWLNIDPMVLFFQSYNGSGYDVACAGADEALIYTLRNSEANWETVRLPDLMNQCYFVHLNKKQNSNTEVAKFQKDRKLTKETLNSISQKTKEILSVDSIESLQNCMDDHEKIMSEILDRKPIKEVLFSDYTGSIKSLGAWGGDFVMVIGEDSKSYFLSKGYSTIIPFNEMIA